MSTVSFLIAIAALSLGTYVMRFAGVKVGAALAAKGARSRSGSADQAPGAPDQVTADRDGVADGAGDSTTAVTRWMDTATVVLIAAVCATTALFDGQDLADPARLIGVGAGIVAAICRVPMLLCVLLAMAVCAVIRMTGVL